MKVRYFTQSSHPWGREDPSETILDVDDLPPLAKRELRRSGIDDLCLDYFYWEAIGIRLWWWVRPVVAS